MSGHFTSRASSKRRALIVERLEGRDLLASFVELGQGSEVADVSVVFRVYGATSGSASTAKRFRWTAAGGFDYFPAAIQPFGLYGNGASGAVTADRSKFVAATRASGEGRVASWSATIWLVDLGVSSDKLVALCSGISADGKYIIGTWEDPNSIETLVHTAVYVWNANCDGVHDTAPRNFVRPTPGLFLLSSETVQIFPGNRMTCRGATLSPTKKKWI